MKSVERVRAALIAAGVGDVIIDLPDSARTAQMAADALSKHLHQEVPVGAIVKSLVFTAGGQPVLVLVAGDRRADANKLKAATGASIIKMADAETVRATTGYAIGGVPPLGHTRPLPILIDEHLLSHAEVWAAAGLPDAVFRVAPRDLERATGARRARLAADSSA